MQITTNKIDSANPEDINYVRENILAMNSKCQIIDAASPLTITGDVDLAGKEAWGTSLNAQLDTPPTFPILLEATREVPKRLQNPKRRTIGIRVPDNAIVQMLLADAKKMVESIVKALTAFKSGQLLDLFLMQLFLSTQDAQGKQIQS